MSRVNKSYNTSKSSDRRLAAGKAAASYLHSQQKPKFEYKAVNKPSNKDESYTVVRSSGTKKWQDSSLLEWDPKHFRLFVGNLGPEVNDEELYKSFQQFESLSKVKVPQDVKNKTNKGYGFVAFASADDYFRAFKEMNGKYVGSRPVQLKRAQTEIKKVKKKK